MTINHTDQLAQWWETAEQGSPSPGDTIIINLGSGGYMIEIASEHWGDWERYDDTRILARAPKPKPAWHDAPAVIATFRDENGVVTGVWVPEGMANYWEGPEGDVVAASALENVTPLIKAKVTDEMVERALNAAHGSSARSLDWYSDSEAGDMRDALTAAFGIRAE